MRRPITPRHATFRRPPRLEALEDRTLPGEALLGALAAAYAADAVAAGETDISPLYVCN